MHTERQGELFILLQTPLWALFPIITILSTNTLPPLTSLAWSTLFSCFVFAAIISIRKKWKETADIPALKDIFWVAVFNGTLYYVLFFFGLRYTSAGNASIIALSEIFFSFLFFHVWHKHHIPLKHIYGAVLVLVGSFIILAPSFSHFQKGDIFIVMATMVAPFGNFFQQKARKRVSSETILLVRSIISAPILFFAAYLLNAGLHANQLRSSMIFLLINGLVLLGLTKLFWVEGIHRINVTKALALASISPLFTILFAWLILHNRPTPWQLLSLIPMIIGVRMLSNRKEQENSPDIPAVPA